MRHAANLLTVLRLALSAPVTALLLAESSLARMGAVLLFVLAGLTDALDGYIARRAGHASALGAFLDPLADKFLVDGAIVALTLRGEFPIPLAAFFLVRDLLIMVARSCSGEQRALLQPGAVAKLKTACIAVGMALLMLVPLAGDALRLPAWVFVWLAAALNVAATLDYGWRALSRRATVDRSDR